MLSLMLVNPRIRRIEFVWAESFRAYSRKKGGFEIETFCWSLGDEIRVPKAYSDTRYIC